VQELNAKIKTLELQLRARPSSPTNTSASHPPLTTSQSRLALKPVESPRPIPRPIPLSSPNSPNGALEIPMLEIYVAETAIEAKKRELEISKEFTNRDMTPRSRSASTVSPRDCMWLEGGKILLRNLIREVNFFFFFSASALKWRMEKGNKLDAFDRDGYLLIHRAVLVHIIPF